MTLESSLAPTTALDAVNDMLRSIGQGQVNTLDEFAGADAASAAACLIQTSREVQERGWYFNTDHDYPFLPDIDGVIAFPDTLLKYSPEWRERHVVERQRKLYNTTTHSFVFPQGSVVKGDVVWLFAFEEIPQAARTYVHRKAGRAFQISAVGSELLYKFTREMEDEALAEFTRAHLSAQRPNIFHDDSHTLSRITAGRNYRG